MEIVALLVAAQLAQATISPAARCAQLVSYYDRYGAGRSNNSDGRRNHTRIAAEFIPWTSVKQISTWNCVGRKSWCYLWTPP